MTMRYIKFTKTGNQVCVLREVILKTGEAVRQSWTFPADIISIRAGEYGLDPIDDFDKVWDIVSHEMNMDDDVESPLFTAATLEDARDQNWARIAKERDKLLTRKRATAWDKDEQKAHDDVLAAVREHTIVDRQLALLAREVAKLNVRVERARRAEEAKDTATHLQKARRGMIDQIRAMEGV